MKLAPFGWDEAAFEAVNRWGRPGFDYLCAWPTYFGDPAILIFAVAAYLLIWDEKKGVWKNIFLISAATCAGFLAARLAKGVLFRPRPYLHYHDLIFSGDYRIHALFELLQKESSFPSGHTATVFACATALVLIYGRRIWPVYLFASFVGLTRVYVGAHFPSDVLAGALIGIGSGFFVMRIGRRVR